MATIINTNTKNVESQSHRKTGENWNGENWVPVPKELETVVTFHAPYIDLKIESGNLVGVTPTERPPMPVPEPTYAERIASLEAQTMYIGMMTEVL